MTDAPDTVVRKIKRAVTDCENTITYDPESRPGVSNLLTIYATCLGISIDEAVNTFSGKGYGVLKSAVTDAVLSVLEPIQESQRHYLKEKQFLFSLMKDGADKAREIALEYDRVGLLIGTHRDVKRVLLALDCTDAVAREAVDINADLVLTHHPLFFKGITRILPDDDKTSAAYILIQHGIGLYSAHTNLDSVPDGVNDTIAENLGIADCTRAEAI